MQIKSDCKKDAIRSIQTLYTWLSIKVSQLLNEFYCTSHIQTRGQECVVLVLFSAFFRYKSIVTEYSEKYS